MTRRVQQLVEDKEWAEAKPLLERLLELYPGFTGPDSAYPMLAAAHRGLGENQCGTAGPGAVCGKG